MPCCSPKICLMALISALPLIWVTLASLTFSSLPLHEGDSTHVQEHDCAELQCAPKKKKLQHDAKMFRSLPLMLTCAKRDSSDRQLRISRPEGEDAKVVAAGHAHAGNDQGLG